MKKKTKKDVKQIDKPTEVGGYKVIRWKVSEETDIVRDFFVKVHDVSEPSRRKPIGRTLLITNIPPFVNEDNLRTMFEAFGTIGEIFFHAKPTTAIPPGENNYFPSEKDAISGYKVAYVVFHELRAVKELMAMDSNQIQPLICGEIVSGVKKWIDAYNSGIVESSKLEADVKKFMTEFEKAEVRRKEEEKQATEPDADGWTTVTNLGRRPGTKRTESTQDKLKAKKRRMEAAVLNITPAQIKATKAKQLDELKKKFDEDKQKIALLKQQRKFKPF